MIELRVNPVGQSEGEPEQCEAAVVIRFYHVTGDQMRVTVGTAGHDDEKEQMAYIATALARLAAYVGTRTQRADVRDACQVILNAGGGRSLDQVKN